MEEFGGPPVCVARSDVCRFVWLVERKYWRRNECCREEEVAGEGASGQRLGIREHSMYYVPEVCMWNFMPVANTVSWVEGKYYPLVITKEKCLLLEF